MIPTIDISLIGILLAAWHVVLTIWEYFTRALNWITQRALAVFIGSKFWATAAFLAISLVLIASVSALFNFISGQLLSIVAPSLSADESALSFIFLFISPTDLAEMFSVGLACTLTYIAIVNLDFARRTALNLFNLLSRSWKT